MKIIKVKNCGKCPHIYNSIYCENDEIFFKSNCMHNDHGWKLEDVTKIHPDCELDDAVQPIVLNLSEDELKAFRDTKNEPGKYVISKYSSEERYKIKEVDLDATTQKAKDDCIKIVGKDLENIIIQKSKDEIEKKKF